MSGDTDEHSELPVDVDMFVGDVIRSRPVHLRVDSIALVGVGGLVGTLARYGMSVLEPTRGGRWPVGTFVVNIAGAFILGVLLEALARSGANVGWRRHTRLALGTGFCGSLTTFSTLAVEADLLARGHDTGLALLYLAASLIAGLFATGAGIAVATGHHHLRATGAGR